jgi:hypothetical protein
MKEMPMAQALFAIHKTIRRDTTAIIREGSLDPVRPYRISPFPRGNTPIRSRCCCEECSVEIVEGLNPQECLK